MTRHVRPCALVAFLWADGGARWWVKVPGLVGPEPHAREEPMPYDEPKMRKGLYTTAGRPT